MDSGFSAKRSRRAVLGLFGSAAGMAVVGCSSDSTPPGATATVGTEATTGTSSPTVAPSPTPLPPSPTPAPTATPLPKGWSQLPDMPDARFYAGVAVSPNGRVWSAGGSAEGIVASKTTTYFDLSTQIWKAGPELREARYGAAAAVLWDGTLLVAGGQNGTRDGIRSTEVLRPGGDRFEAGPDMVEARGRAPHALLNDGRFLVVGGFSGGDLTVSAEIFDPTTSAWQLTSELPFEIADGTALVLRDGRVLIGQSLWLTASGGAYGHTFSPIYTPSLDTWSVSGPTSITSAGWVDWDWSWTTRKVGREIPSAWRPDSRYGGEITLLGDGRVLSVGGSGQEGTPIGLAEEVFNPATNQWTRVAPSRYSRLGLVALVLRPDGQVLMSGLTQNPDGSQTSELYDSKADTWKDGGTHFVPSGGLNSAHLPDGSLLLFTGRPRIGRGYYPSTQIYVP